MIARTLPVLLLLTALSANGAPGPTCPSPVAEAESLYSRDHDFAFRSPVSLKTRVTPELRAALSAEYARCGAVQEECIDADVWTGQNGLVPTRAPHFSLMSELNGVARVAVESTLEQDGAPTLVTRVSVSLTREESSGCWAIQDLTLVDSSSLLSLLTTN